MGITRESFNGPKPQPRPEPTKPEPGDPIPAEFRELNQWVVWRLTARRDGDKPTKLPFQSLHPNVLASSTDPETWSSYDDACRAFADPANNLSGIGFVFTDSDPYCGIDFDHVRDPETGDIDSWVFPITQAITGYLETSYSQTGLHLVIKAKFPEGGRHNEEGFGKNGTGKIEIYDCGRYFAFTGKGSNNVRVLTDQQEEFDRQYARLFPPKPKPEYVKPSLPLTLDDEALIRKIEESQQGEKFRKMFREGEVFDKTGQSSTDIALCNILAFWCQGDPVAIDRLFRQSALMRDKWDDHRGGETYGQRTIRKACEGRGVYHDPGYRSGSDNSIRTGPALDHGQTDFHDSGNGKKPNRGNAAEDDGRPVILITPEEHEVNNLAIDALAEDPEVFCRSKKLVRIAFDHNPPGYKSRVSGTPDIVEFDKWGIRERLTKNAVWVAWKTDGRNEDGDRKMIQVRSHPPEWSAPQIIQRGHWPKVRPIIGLTETPIMRHDGSIIEEPGYDAASSLYYIQSRTFPRIPTDISRQDAANAAWTILDVVKDFPFAIIDGDGGIGHKAAFLAALLTPIGRYAIAGPCPMFVLDANTPGVGKTKLSDMISNIVSGRDIARMPYAENNEEMEKRIMSIAMNGDRMVLLDNIQTGSSIGGAALDLVLTSTIFKGRVLSKNIMPEYPMYTIWIASGNNLGLKGDALRRVVPIRLETEEQRPEERTFDLEGEFLDHVQARREELFVAAMSILRGFVLAGSPQDKTLTPMDYPAWCGLIRQAVKWAIDVDPCITRNEMVKADPESNASKGLLEGWYELQESPGSFASDGMTASHAIKLLEKKENDNSFTKLREIFLEWSKADGRMPTPHVVSMRLRKIKGRKIGHMKMVTPENQSGTQVWKVIDDRPENERPAF